MTYIYKINNNYINALIIRSKQKDLFIIKSNKFLFLFTNIIVIKSN